MQSPGKLTPVSNYETHEYPLLHLFEEQVKEYSQQRANELRNIQQLTRRYPEVFVQHFCALLEETASGNKKGALLSVIKEGSVGDEQSILKAAEDKERMQQEIRTLKLRAKDCLGCEMISYEKTKLVVCLVKRQEKPMLKISFREYTFHPETNESEEIRTAVALSDHIVTDPGVMRFAQQQIVEFDDSSINVTGKLLRIEQAYFSNVFAETDQLVKYKQFEGDQKWLEQFPTMISFEQTVGEKSYPTIPYYSNVSCRNHFFGWSSQGKSEVEKDRQNGKMRRCHKCKQILSDFVQDTIMNRLMTCIYNPKRSSIYYFPAANRFKLVNQKTGQVGYENYYHFKDTLLVLGLGIPRFPCVNGLRQEFSLTFQIKDLRMLIEDPCRGKSCRHLSFCDMRDLYRTKKNLYYTCPICKQQIQDGQILYLKQVKPLLKLAKQIMKEKKGDLKGFHSNFRLEVYHGKHQKEQTVRMKYRLHFGDQEEIKEIPRIYKSLQDPLYPFDESQLDLKDQSLQQQVEDYYWPKEISTDY